MADIAEPVLGLALGGLDVGKGVVECWDTTKFRIIVSLIIFLIIGAYEVVSDCLFWGPLDSSQEGDGFFMLAHDADVISTAMTLCYIHL